MVLVLDDGGEFGEVEMVDEMDCSGGGNGW